MVINKHNRIPEWISKDITYFRPKTDENDPGELQENRKITVKPMVVCQIIKDLEICKVPSVTFFFV